MTPATQQRVDAVDAEAAAWIVRLHSQRRTPALEAGLRRWLAEDPSHAQIFESMTQAWDDATALAANEPFPRVRKLNPLNRSKGPLMALAAAILIVCTATAFFAWKQDPAYITNVGEQRTVRLPDGSRITLNSASRLKVQYSPSRRQLTLEQGEAFFEAAKDPRRPFIVQAGKRRVTALGTTFTVRYELDRTAITLLDGKVAVSAIGGGNAPRPVMAEGAELHATKAQRGMRENRAEGEMSATAKLSQELRTASSERAATPQDSVILTPGQRLIIRTATFFAPAEKEGARASGKDEGLSSKNPTEAQIDTPRIDAVTAWRRGEVVLESTPLSEALTEMNRYDERHLQVSDPRLANLLVSGIYRIGDNQGFAQAIARIYDLTVVGETQRILLTAPDRRNGT